MLQLNAKEFAGRFPEPGWTYDPDMVELEVSRSDGGGGYTIWHVPDTDVTYLDAVSW